MPLDNLQSYKVANQELSSSTKFNNLVQAIEDALNSIEYVNMEPGSEGQVLKTVSGAVAWASLASVGYGTSLPGSPANGDEYILVDSTTAPTYAWRFRYNASSSSSYKWEFVGGSAKIVEEGTDNNVTSTSYVDFTNNVSFTLPLAGDWEIEYGATVQNAATFVGNVSPYLGATAVDADAIWSSAGSQPAWASHSRVLRKNALAASTLIKLQWKTGGGTTSGKNKYLRIRPIRVI